jgi:TolB-like protein
LFTLLLLPFWILVLTGCAAKGDVRTTTHKKEISLQKIAVIPFQIVAPEDQTSNTVRCPLSGNLARSCSTPEGAADIIEDLFLERLKTNSKLVIIPGDKTEGVYRRIGAESFKASPIHVFRKVGGELGVDGVAVGYVYCYRERKGYAYSAEKPASVSFEIGLIRVSDGAILWNSYFDRTQESLMENLLHISTFIRGGGKWVTAKQLSAEGMERMMETFPGIH